MASETSSHDITRHGLRAISFVEDVYPGESALQGRADQPVSGAEPGLMRAPLHVVPFESEGLAPA